MYPQGILESVVRFGFGTWGFAAGTHPCFGNLRGAWPRRFDRFYDYWHRLESIDRCPNANCTFRFAPVHKKPYARLSRELEHETKLVDSTWRPAPPTWNHHLRNSKLSRWHFVSLNFFVYDNSILGRCV